MKPRSLTVICDYCGKDAELVDGKKVYPHRPDLHKKRFWLCRSCQAYVGCHGRGIRPLGRLANAELRKAKMQAHSLFDRHWKNGSHSRSECYRRLAKALGIKIEDCHIGHFDLNTVNKVIQLCTEEVKDGRPRKGPATAPADD